MYKTLNRLNVYIHGDENPYTFTDAATLPSGITALSQVKNCRDIDAILNEGGIPTIIPYHAIDNIEVLSVRIEEEDPVDDNCTVDGGDEPAEPGTLKITNASGDDLTDIAVFASGSVLDGVYGDLTFDGSVATIASLADGASVTATGIPNGTDISVQSHAGTNHGTVPVLITIGGGHGPK